MRADARAAHVCGARVAVVRARIGIVRVLATQRGAAIVSGAGVVVVATHGTVLATERRVAAVCGAGVRVVTIQRCAGLATEGKVASFGAVADLPVVASSVARLMCASLGRLVAGVLGARNAIVAVDRGAGHAAAGQALLGAVAE